MAHNFVKQADSSKVCSLCGDERGVDEERVCPRAVPAVNYATTDPQQFVDRNIGAVYALGVFKQESVRYIANAVAVECKTKNCLLACRHCCTNEDKSYNQNLFVCLPSGDGSITTALIMVTVVAVDDAFDLVVLRRTDGGKFPVMMRICPMVDVPKVADLSHNLLPLYANVHDFMEGNDKELGVNVGLKTIAKCILSNQVKMPWILNPGASGCGVISLSNGCLVGIYTSFNATVLPLAAAKESVLQRQEEKGDKSGEVTRKDALWESISTSSNRGEHSGYAILPCMSNVVNTFLESPN